MSRIIPCFLCAFLVVMLSGCGGSKVPLKGKVTFKEDGSPLTRGLVCFETATYRARGPLTADGTYRVSSEKTNDGIPPGLYKVYIFGAEAAIDNPGNKMNAPRAVPLVAVKYTNADTSGITIEIDGKTKEFNFEVEKP